MRKGREALQAFKKEHPEATPEETARYEECLRSGEPFFYRCTFLGGSGGMKMGETEAPATTEGDQT